MLYYGLRRAETRRRRAILLSAAMIALPFTAVSVRGAPVVHSGSGDISGVVAGFRTALGEPNNANTPGPLTSGRREINWDGGGGAAPPVDMPADQFAGRGVVFATAGTGFQISGADGNPANTAADEEFGNINPAYPALFATFSPEKLFTAVGSNVLDVNFFVPGDVTTPALTQGFGAVFTDVDAASTTMIEFFDQTDALVRSEFAPVAQSPEEGLSFVGVTFDTASIRRVRITSGNAALGTDVNEGDGTDLVVMDDFVFGEPQTGAGPPPVIPLPPAALSGLLAAVPMLHTWRRWRRHGG